MSPEQIGSGNMDIDTRSDVYSLGALLYELLAGSPVFDLQPLLARGGYAEIQRVIQSIEPPSPSQRCAGLEDEARLRAADERQTTPDRWLAALRGDLDRIVLTCLEKDRGRRYGTAEDLARDIERYLHHEPVHARPATLGYRAKKFMRRHRRGVFAVAVGLTFLTGFSVYHAHRLATERDRAQFEARKAAKISEVLTEVLGSGDPFRTPTSEGILEASAAKVRQEFATQPDVRMEILNAVGRVFLRRGEQEKARPVLTEALAAGRELGRPDVRLAQTLSDLGILRRETGDVAGSLPMLEEALAMRRQLRGNDHNEVAISLVELGRAHSTLEQLERAESLFREALLVRQKVLGDEHREVAVSLGDVALVLWNKGELVEAEPFFMRSIAMHRKTVGPDHPNVGQSLANLAQLKVDQGDLVAAESLVRDALSIVRRSFGEKHWRTARMIGHLGNILRLQRRLDEAAPMLDEALQMARASLGPDRPQVAALSVERAQAALDLDDPAAAEPLLRDALRVQRLTSAEDSWRLSSTKSLLGAALLGLDRISEAEPLLVEAHRHLKEIPGPQGRETKPNRERLAALLRMKVSTD
jgi:tetratricopeptide (TPR) repeat protein